MSSSHYTLYIQLPTDSCSGDITLLGFNGKYRSFFWHDSWGAWARLSFLEKQAKLFAWLDTVEKDLGIDTSPHDEVTIQKAVLNY